MAKITIPNSGLWSAIAGILNANFTDAFNATGWAQYADTAYTDIAPFSIVADTDTLLPNNGGSVLNSQLPTDITSYYTGGKITGQDGDAICVTIDMVALPTEAATTTLEVWLDIGTPVGELYRRIISFPKGVGVARPVSFTVMAYQLDTWAANGSSVNVRANGSCNFYNIRYLVARVHKAV